MGREYLTPEETDYGVICCLAAMNSESTVAEMRNVAQAIVDTSAIYREI